MIHSILLKPFHDRRQLHKSVRFSPEVQVAMLDENGAIIHYSAPSTSQSAYAANKAKEFHFQNVSLTDYGVSDFIMEPVLKSICDPHKKGFVRFISVKKVINGELDEKFQKKQNDFMSMGIPSEFEYGFFCLTGVSSKEEEDFCRFGLKTGTNYMGEIGDATEGIYFSRYADVSSPALFMSGQPVRMLVCKVLLGRAKKVIPQPNKTGWKICPDRNFNSHISADTNLNLADQPPHIRYRHSQMFVYEFDRSGRTTVDRPASIFPMAIISLDIAKPGPDLLNLMSIKLHASTVWNGTLQVQSQTVKHVTLHSHHNLMSRPRGLDSLNIPYILSYSSMMNFHPFASLFNDDKMGLLMRHPEVCLKTQNRSECFVQYFVLKCEESEHFEDLCILLKKESVVGYTRLSNGTRVVLVPGGGLSFKLGLTNYEYATIHCLFFADRPYDFANKKVEFSGYYAPLTDKIRPEQRIDLQDPDVIRSLDRLLPPKCSVTRPVTPPARNHPTPPMSESPQIPEDPKLPEVQKLPEFPKDGPELPRLPDLQKKSQIPKLSEIRPLSQMSKLFELPDLSHPPPNLIPPRGAPIPSSTAPRLPYDFSARAQKRAAPLPDMSIPPPVLPKVRRDDPEGKKNAENVIKQLKEVDKEHIFKDPRMEMLRKRDPERFVEVVKEKSLMSKDQMNKPIEEPPSMPSLPVAKSDTISAQMAHKSTDPPASKKQPVYADKWPALPSMPPSRVNGQPGSPIKPMKLDNNALSGILGGKWFSGGQDIDMRTPAGPSQTNPPQCGVGDDRDVVVIMDPELVILNDISVCQMNELLNAATVKNGQSSKKVSIYWHLCNQEWLDVQKNNPIDKVVSERSKSFLHLIRTYKASGLVKDMERHVCDQAGRSPNKYLICSMNTKRKYPHARVVFLSALIHPNFGNGPNFLANNVELITPAELMRSFKSS
uniref:DUF3715 domain-containing protein n=1 Tax=Bursaphelenchus xylophilus TaxID=6326 RepID=A0A1I7S3D4_BURXY